MSPFASYCRDLRFRHNVSLKKLAEALSVSPSYLSALENSKSGKPPEKIVHKICEFYSLTSVEKIELEKAAHTSGTSFKIRNDADKQVYRVVNLMMDYVYTLSNLELEIIELILNKKQQKEEISMNLKS